MTYHSNITGKDKFIDICNLTTSLVGLEKGSLSCKSRKHKFQAPRCIAAIIGRLEDIHPTIIARILKRDRVSIYHYERVHEGHYASWEYYRNTFNLIITAYSDLKGNIPEFKNCVVMKSYILQFVKESSKEQVEIIITSGKVGCKIKTSFIDFSYILQNLKIALKEYSHSISIKLL